MNPVLILTRNNIDLTKRCVNSAMNQDVLTRVFLVDNGSTDGTVEFFGAEHPVYLDQSSYYLLDYSRLNKGVSKAWNHGLTQIFKTYDSCLVIGNDTILPKFCYSALLSVDVPFVTGVDIGMNPLPDKPDILPLSPHPDFSCFLIRRECWEKVGPFDEKMVLYSSDQDYHIRAHHAGVHLWKACVPYQHERSSTLNRASLEERQAIHLRANLDRAELRKKWGVPAGGPLYEALFSPGTFGIKKGDL